MRKFGSIAVALMLPLALFGARLTLVDGTVVRGQFISGSSENIIFQDEAGVRRRFDLNQVQTIDFGGSTEPSRTGAERRDDRRDDRRADRRDNLDNAVIPAGTQVSVRTDQEISSDNTSEGRTYPATIQQDVMDNSGAVMIPRGTPADLVIRRVNEGGTTSNGSLVLDLDSVRVNGHRYTVSTGDIRQGDAQGIGANRRTATMVGGGAVLGTLLGAVAGGGKGAAIGAIAGAAAGGGVQVLTKGHQIRVPAETVLNFRLDQPLQLRDAQ